jgi:VacB/RNase II family 3'-5' exoribonuclease
MLPSAINLKERARRAVLEAGFHPDFPPEVLQEVNAAKRGPRQVSATEAADLRSLLWSSIDNDNSRDLDQVEYVEKLPDGTTRLLVGIADVDALVPKGAATDHRAATECTSVYTAVETFPMLPAELSTDLTSLGEAQERLATVIEVRVQSCGDVDYHAIQSARVRNQAKLAYSTTGAWLEGRARMPTAVASAPGMEAQIRLQQETAAKLRLFRKQHGALVFSSREPTPIVGNGAVKDLVLREHTAAEDIIESFMVAANVAMAKYLREQQRPSIRRVVKTPRRWDRIQAIAAQYGTRLPDAPDPRALSEFLASRQAADPLHFPDLSLSILKLLGPGEYLVEAPGTEKEGHFGLAVTDYTHSTAPNRRYADLVTQRLLKATAVGHPSPYAVPELALIATRCTDREDAARKLERLLRKIIAASLLSQRIGERFNAIVTGASPKGTYLRLINFPAEGRLVRGMQGMDVGDKLFVRLASADVDKGFIDFERVS